MAVGSCQGVMCVNTEEVCIHCVCVCVCVCVWGVVSQYGDHLTEMLGGPAP
jgi:hypothetical protein